ncbi:hypothetical protein BLA29_001333 [Euroglyphus maynei]|uniref:J domain-containing protein n=1 Tax=Euroglyphus maynei TaxID=6958 RepID=A0A1Y3ATV0_EURMA|nr:hypothetical protein BLA29_001333 [Euroglyphus maynei]
MYVMSLFATNVGQNFKKIFLSPIVTGHHHCCLTTGHYHVRSLWTTKHVRKRQENYYNILGLKQDCSQDQIRTAYLNLCKKYHPDLSSKNNTSEQQMIDDTARFQKINEAYNCLCKVDTRNQYDLSLNFGLGNNPFIKRSPTGYYHYHQSPFSDRATYNYYRQMRYRETMYQERDGYSKFHSEIIGSKFTGFILLSLVITIILEGINSWLNSEMRQMNMKKRYEIITEIYKE